MSPTGLMGGWVDAPTDLPGFGELQWEESDYGMAAGGARAMVGGPEYHSDSGLDNTGFTRIATGVDMGAPIPGQAHGHETDWRFLFNWEHNPTFWILLFALGAVGLIHARLELGGQVGRYRAGVRARV